jgi:thioesterase domain-containing protein
MKGRIGIALAKLLAVFAAFSLTLSAQQFSVNGHKLFLQCGASTSLPTVILVAGAGGTTETWDKVQPQISSFARVCSYDRAGLGKSEKLDHVQSAEQIVDDLAALLKAAHIPPPYVLVGHSIGGIYVRKFDQRYDSLVAGIVLIDSSHEEQIWRFAKDEPQVVKDEFPNWRDTAAIEAEGFLAPQQRLSWHFSKQLVVLEHGIPPEPVWHAMQEDLASRSPQGKLITAEHSSHYIQKLQPELVIQSVREVCLAWHNTK